MSRNHPTTADTAPVTLSRRRHCRTLRQPVMAGLDPAIHPLRKKLLRRTMDPRVRPAGDGKDCSPSWSINRDPSPLDQMQPALLRLRQIGRNVLGRGWSRFGAQSRKGLLDLG